MDRTLTLEEVNDTFKLLRNTRCRDSSCSAYATERGPISYQTCLLDSPAREASLGRDVDSGSSLRVSLVGTDCIRWRRHVVPRGPEIRSQGR